MAEQSPKRFLHNTLNLASPQVIAFAEWGIKTHIHVVVCVGMIRLQETLNSIFDFKFMV